MLKLTMRLLTIGLAGTLAGPAAAGTLYKWTGADGSVAFTDDAKRVPERYRAQAEKIETSGLDRYSRYTPTDAAAHRAHGERLNARLERLREERAAGEVAAAVPAAALAGAIGPGSETVVQLNDDTAIRVPTHRGEDGPMVVEEVRVRRPGSNFTIHDTVVRQGDKVLLVVRPAQPHQAGPGDFIDEAELLE